MDQVASSQIESRAKLLVIIGDIHNENQKNLALRDLENGLKTWNKTQAKCNIQEELNEASNKFQISEEGSNGEKNLQFSSENVIIEILLNPQLRILVNRMKNFFTTGGCYHHFIYSGIVIYNSGSWVLQDSLYNLSNFADLFRSAEVINAIKQNVLRDHVVISLNADTDWTESQFSKFSNSLKFCLNPPIADDTPLGQDFLTLLVQHVKVPNVTDLLKASNVVGNIRFTRPTLYIFPGCQGDSSLFGISGFNLLIDAGYGRKSAFWDFTRHLDRIDALILSHLGPDNLFGLSSVIDRKLEESLHPEISCVFLNAISDLSKIVYSDKEPGLSLNVMSESTKLIDKMKQIGLGARSCLGSISNGNLQSINLYHKVGHGSLDLFVLNPMHDSKTLKDFLQAWSKGASAFTSSKGCLPLCNSSSVCSLIVWRPSSLTDSITRLLFPGSVSQDILFEGLDHLRGMNLFKHAQCCEKDLVISKVASARKVPVRPSNQRPAKPSLGGTAVSSPKSDVGSPRSEISSKDKKMNWPTKKESAAPVENKKPKTKKVGEKFIPDEGAPGSKTETKPKIEGCKDVSSPKESEKSESQRISETDAKLSPSDLLIPMKSEKKNNLAGQDSLENLKELRNHDDDKKETEGKDVFDGKSLQEGLKEDPNPFLGIDAKEDAGNLEAPMALPPPVPLGSKESANPSTSPRKTLPHSSSSLSAGEKKPTHDSKFPSFQRKPESAKFSRDNSKNKFRGAQKPAPPPTYVDLAYVPDHGDPKSVDVEFFKRVRARYYVFSTVSPDAGVLTALMEAKQTWQEEAADLETTIIPTYDTEVLRYWLAAHHEQLSRSKIGVAPAANRCTIQLQDHETSCAAFRLEF